MATHDVRALKDKAVAAMATGDLHTAIQLYEQIAAAEPHDPRWLMKIGEASRALADIPRAVRAFRDASLAYVREGFDLKAVAACRVLLQVAPGDPEATALIDRLAPRASMLPPLRSTKPPRTTSASFPAAPPMPAMANPAPATTASDAPDLVFDGEERITLEHIEIARVLPGKQSPDAPAGTVDITIDAARAPEDTAYLDLRGDDESAVRKPAPPSSGLELASIEPEAEPERLSLLELDASDELFNRKPLALTPAEPPRPRVDAERLAGLPLLGQLPREALSMLVRRIDVLDVAPGDRVIAEGDIPDSVYIVVRGDLVATRGTPPRPLARVGEGSFFGEMALLDDTPRSASVTAVTDAELLVLRRELIMELGARFPTVLASLIQSLRARLIATLTATSPLFALIPVSERRGIVDRFTLREIEPGIEIIRQGTRADALYVILTGRADVVANGLPIATLTTGDLAGEMSLLSHGVAGASVRARTRVAALTLSAAGLQEIIMVHPQVLDHLATLSEARRSELELRQSHLPLEARNVRSL